MLLIHLKIFHGYSREPQYKVICLEVMSVVVVKLSLLILSNLLDIWRKYATRTSVSSLWAISYQMTAFLLLKLAYSRTLDLNEMLQPATVCLSISFSITPLTGSEEGVEMLTNAANCRMCVVRYLLAALWKLNGPVWLKSDFKAEWVLVEFLE